MKLVIVSGLSGSGKSIALNTLEDNDYFCVDNLPVGLLSDFVSTMKNSKSADYEQIAVAVDARCGTEDMGHFEHILKEIKSLDVDVDILFLLAQDSALLTRFSETRRKHPLSHNGLTLTEAINTEREILLAMGEWLAVCGEAIYETRPWRTHATRADFPTRAPTTARRKGMAGALGEAGSSNPGMEKWCPASVAVA